MVSSGVISVTLVSYFPCCRHGIFLSINVVTASAKKEERGSVNVPTVMANTSFIYFPAACGKCLIEKKIRSSSFGVKIL